MFNFNNNLSNSQINNNRIFLLDTLKTPKTGRRLAIWLIAIMVSAVILSFLPWQQNIFGKGLVTSFTPGKRPQTIETAIAGRISKWHIQEGQKVRAGDTILTISEVKEKFFDPNLLARIQDQIEAKKGSIDSKTDKVKALQDQINALKEAKEIKLTQSRNKYSQAQYKLNSDSVDFEGEKIKFANAESVFLRNQKLYELGNITLTKFQTTESKYQESRMKLISAENKFLQSKAELINTMVQINGVEAEYNEKISKSESDLNATLSELYESEGELAKQINEFANLSIRNEQYQIIAPQNGTIIKALKAGIGETIKEGEAVATILPDSVDLAIEMYVNAMDVPLISKYRKVRIEFDGWPALQFSGWPSVAVGTFGGVVKVIDNVNSKNGLFRILVVPDSEDVPWPQQLRLGSGAKGWVMLDDVPIWFETWRQLNGFPPSLYEEPKYDDQDKSEK